MTDDERSARVEALRAKRSASGHRKRRHAAPAARVAAAGLSVAGTFALLAGMALGDQAPSSPALGGNLSGQVLPQAQGAVAPTNPERIPQLVERVARRRSIASVPGNTLRPAPVTRSHAS